MVMEQDGTTEDVQAGVIRAIFHALESRARRGGRRPVPAKEAEPAPMAENELTVGRDFEEQVSPVSSRTVQRGMR